MIPTLEPTNRIASTIPSERRRNDSGSSRAATSRFARTRSCGLRPGGLEEELRQARGFDAEVGDMSVPADASRTPPGSAWGSRRRRVPRASIEACPRSSGTPTVGRPAHRHATSDWGSPPQRAHASVQPRTSFPEGDRLAEVLDQVELMAREPEVAPARVSAVITSGGSDRYGIEAGERLVEHQEVGAVHHRGGELHALRHAPDRVEVLSRSSSARSSCPRSCTRASLPLDAIEAVQARDPHRQVETRMRGTGAVPAACTPIGGGRRPHRTVLPRERARLRREDAEEDAHQRGLAGAVRSGGPTTTPGRNLEVHVPRGRRARRSAG